ncbi:CBS domain-containing protein [Poseidonocella sp. HB161398]|uniref:CBS domain-containing protein n=1 Tax=Poseidonocella sp. HB161398 TaxID=2320855 RepID=UPI00110861C8|nr:CBS domain-containing protein [Poseidonocella sp. HB161398]
MAGGDETIAAVMRRDFLALRPDLPMREAVAQLVAARASAAPVIGPAGQLAGILTQKDCFGPALSAAYYQRWSDTVAQHMSREVAVLDAGTEIVAAAEQFRDLPYRAFPVIENGQVAGMLSRSDLLAALLARG